VSAAAQLKVLAEQGDPKARLMLAEMYFDGLGVDQDYREAVNWCRRAAQQGFDSAQHYLGRMYTEGVALPKDKVEAYTWFKIAAQGGNFTAREGCEVLTNQMSAAETDQAEERARELRQQVRRQTA
jgi:uncharacterized protein